MTDQTTKMLRVMYPKTMLWDAVRLGRAVGTIMNTTYKLMFWPWFIK